MGTGDIKINERSNKRERAKQAKRGRRNVQGEFAYEERDLIAVIALAVAFANSGGALRVGKTRDGGAAALGCYLGDDYGTEYVRPAEDFAEAVMEIAEAWLPENGLEYHRLYNLFINGGKKP